MQFDYQLAVSVVLERQQAVKNVSQLNNNNAVLSNTQVQASYFSMYSRCSSVSNEATTLGKGKASQKA